MSEFVVTKSEKLRGDAEFLQQAILEHLHFTLAKDRYTATKRDLFQAVAFAVRDQLIGRWIKTQQQYYDADAKRVYYLSLEFLMGQSLKNSLTNLNILENCRKAVHDLGFDLDLLIEIEDDAGLGNGGLGRLAACFLDSMATLNIPGYGYGIRYDFGIFTQKIENRQQVEHPDNWLQHGHPWEFPRCEYLYPIQFYGKVEHRMNGRGEIRAFWVDSEEIEALAYDVPIPGYQNDTVNTLRLWQAKASEGFDLTYFNHGDYIRAVEEIAVKENISKVLYPNDNIFEGKELRLKQEYFLVSATLQDILRRYNKAHLHLDQLKDKIAIQLNDTHPALAIAEMMRLLVDREELSWNVSWEAVQEIFGYTNHTLLPEALERWPLPLIEKVLPRHAEIIKEINQRWLKKVEDSNTQEALTIIEPGSPPLVNMARLAIVGSHKVNGVSKLHSELLQTHVFPEFAKQFPDKFTNKTNGITPRRWLKMCNPSLSNLITDRIGNGWTTDLFELKKLRVFAEDEEFQTAFARVKMQNKEHLANLIFSHFESAVDPHSLFDVQIKRLHEYKRQLLNALHVIWLYNRLKANPNFDCVPRTVLIAGKAAPGYFIAKMIIELILQVANVINQDPDTNQKLKLFFLPNYRVSLAEKIIPAANLSEQISTAGTEASGTGNMKFALNGALTIGTLDGANIEMMEEVGEENFFLFGLKADEVEELKKKGYNSREYYEKDPELKEVIDQIQHGFFSQGDQNHFKPLTDSLLDGGDSYCLFADFRSYIDCQKRVNDLYQEPKQWNKQAIFNVAGMGQFSSDRTIQEYANEIWKL